MTLAIIWEAIAILTYKRLNFKEMLNFQTLSQNICHNSQTAQTFKLYKMREYASSSSPDTPNTNSVCVF